MHDQRTGALAVLPSAQPAPIRTADELAAAFLAGYSDATRRAYATDLRCWGDFLARHGVEPLAARRVTVDAYVRQLELDGRAPSTVARRLNALAGFYRYAVDEGLLDRSPLAGVRRPKVSELSPNLGLDRDELRALLAAGHQSGPRDHALASLLVLNGLRISETLRVDVADVDQERGHHTLRLNRKGGARQTVALAPRTATAIAELLDGRDAGPLFVTRTGRRLDRHAAAKVVGKLARRAGITKRISPHSCRHGFVTAALDAGVSLRDVQDAAGHADPRTTRRYDRARGSLDRSATYSVATFLAD